MQRLYRYNRGMDSSTAARLITINQEFYSRFGASFSATRHRIQPGVRRLIHILRGNESILDLGCGNGEFARELALHGHYGTYLGVDFSPPLLQDAAPQPQGFSANFLQADLTHLKENVASLKSKSWDVITAFAVLHHIPSEELRIDLLQSVRELLAGNGMFILSNWQFLNSEKLKARIKPWESAGISSSSVDTGDYLLDWRSGGEGLRYVHHFGEAELITLANVTGFQVTDSFYSDGEGGNLGLYQVWQIAARY